MTLIETVVAVTLFTMVGSAVLAGVSMAQSSGSKTEGQSIAENIARNQMEYVFSLPYQDPPSTYPAVAVPTGYSVSVAAEEYVDEWIVVPDVRIEKVTVSVSHGGQQVLFLETLRTR